MLHLRNEWKAFYRKKALPILALLSQLFLNLYWWNEIRQARYDNPVWGFDSMYAMFSCFAIYFVALIYISYEYMAQAFQGDVGEMLIANRIKFQVAGGKAIVLNGYIGLTCLSFAGWSFFAFKRFHLPLSLLGNWAKAVLLYFVFVGEIAVLLGFALSLLRRRLGSVLAILGIVFLTTDLSESLWIFLEQVGVNTRAIQTALSPGIPVGSLTGEEFYGFPAEKFRIFVLLTWLACAVLLIVAKMSFAPSFKKAVVAALPIFVLGICIYQISFPRGYPLWGSEDYYYVKDRENNYNGESAYYQDTPAAKETRGRFSVLAYSLDLKITNQLEVMAAIELDRLLPQYDFTLVHSYEVMSVQTGEGVSLPFTQSGDVLTVDNTEGVTHICVLYRGANKLYYSSDQALNLPGYWAYYPRAGSTRTFGRLRGMGDGFYLPIQDQQPVDIQLEIDAPYPIYSNLNKQSDGSYAGKTTGLTLVGGLVRERVGDDGSVGVRADVYARERDIEITDVVPNIRKAIAQLQREYPAIGEVELPASLKTIQVPQLVNDTGNPYVFSDHIVFKDYLSGRELAANYIVMQMRCSPEKREIANALKEYLADKKSFVEMGQMGGIVNRYSTQYAFVRGTIADAVQGQDEQTVVKIIIEYLEEDADTRTPYKFLWDLQRRGES